jgi:predicted AAA+ superfamily ATPase
MTKIINRMITFPDQSFFLFGPRGTGKTTWINHKFPDAYKINLLDESLYQSYLMDISLFAGELRALKKGDWVFIDEIQRLPNVLNEVHRFIEELGLQFILTGSSARKLRTSGVNLLAGRALNKRMFPFLPSELGTQFDVKETLMYGSLPLVWNTRNKKETLKSYVQMYLKEEIKAEALVRNLPGFVRFLPIAALFHGQTLNISSLARDAGVSRTTISGYVDILEDTLLTYRLPAFQSKLRVREKKHPKLYWIDPGIVRAVNNRFGELYPEEQGALFEGWIASVLLAYKEYKEIFEEWYYWSPAAAQKTEVDFLLERNREYIAIEVKNSKKIKSVHLKGLNAISELKGLKKRILIYPGDKKMIMGDNIEIWPLHGFLDMLDNDRLWK